MKKRYDHTGIQYGLLTGVKFLRRNNDRKSVWLWQCDCGNQIERDSKDIVYASKKNKKPLSCGCSYIPHGDAVRTNDTPHRYIYSTWADIRARLSNPNHVSYHNYGGRGIKLHPEWDDYLPFKTYVLDTLGERPEGFSLDRIDNDGHYEPGNLRWADFNTQHHNKRKPVRNSQLEETIKELELWKSRAIALGWKESS